MRIKISKSFEKGWQKLDKQTAKIVAEKLNATSAAFGKPHSHAGLGIRQLRGIDAYEVRLGLSFRAVFQVETDCLYFRIIGTHDEVEAWIRNNA